jgi:hypothetical protein
MIIVDDIAKFDYSCYFCTELDVFETSLLCSTWRMGLSPREVDIIRMFMSDVVYRG